MPAVILLLVSFVTRLAGLAVTRFLGSLGMLLFLVILLSFSMFLLEQSLLNKRAEHVRIWDGMLAGLFAWLVLSSVEMLGPSALAGRNGLLVLLMVSIITFILWRRIYPVGMKYFSIVLLANWSALVGFNILNQFFHHLKWFPYLTGGLSISAGIAGFLLAVWILLSSRTRTQRMRYSAWLWFCCLLILIFLQFPFI